MSRPFRGTAWILVSLLVGSAALATSGRANAALQRPTYAAGDRWDYVLEGSLSTFPGIDDSEFGSFRFDIVGLVEVDVIGPAELARGSTAISGVRVASRTSGFLNGTFTVPGFGTGEVMGSFQARASEFWEEEAYLPLASESRSTYDAQISFVISTTLEVDTLINATTSVSTIPPFDLEVGQSATAELETHLVANSTVTFFGDTVSSENETQVSSTWQREVISLEIVTVEAGTFSTYKLNQSLASFPGVPGGIVAGGNETAYFSNETGYYAKRVAYENGTPVAETRLRSFSYGKGQPSGPNLEELIRFVALPAAAIALFGVMVWRRESRRRNRPGGRPPSKADPHGEGNHERPR